MTSLRAENQRLLIVDSRPTGTDVLRVLVERASERYEVDLVRSVELALDSIGRVRPTAVLVEAEADEQLGLPAGGPLIAALCKRRHPALPLLLYRRADSRAAPEQEAARLGLSAPVVADRRLIDGLGSLIADLLEHARALSSLPSAAADEPTTPLPTGFRIERFLARVERALVYAAAHEHADRAEAAAALCMPFETFVSRLNRHSLSVSRVRRQESNSGQRVLWCSERKPPSGLSDACDQFDVGLRCVPPGQLHPVSVVSSATIAAIIDPDDVASAADGYLLDRSLRPFLLLGSPMAPLEFVLEEMGVRGWRESAEVPVPAMLLRAGHCAASLYGDEQVSLRLAFRSDGHAAWPIDCKALLARLDARVLSLARRTTSSVQAAADAVGLPERTFRRRLRGARSP